MESGFLKFLGNSLIVSTFSTVLCLAIGSPTACALTKIEQKLKNIFLVWIILIRMVPAMTYVIPFCSGADTTGGGHRIYCDC